MYFLFIARMFSFGTTRSNLKFNFTGSFDFHLFKLI